MTTLVCAGALAIALLPPRSREPTYQGHTLSWWIHLYESNPVRSGEAKRAIQHIGTNALPTLLDWIRYDEPQWRLRLIPHLYTLGPRSLLQELAVGPAGLRTADAIMGFDLLGPAAYPAAAELVALAVSKSPFVSHNAMYVIEGMRGQKALILAAGLTNSESTVRLRAAESIGLCFQLLGPTPPTRFNADPAPAVPFLVNAFNDPDSNVRQAATNTLRLIAPKELEKAAAPAPLVPNTATD